MIPQVAERPFLGEFEQAKIISKFASSQSILQLIISSIFRNSVVFSFQTDCPKTRLRFSSFRSHLKIDNRVFPFAVDLEDPISMVEMRFPINVHPKSLLEQERHLFDYFSLFDQHGFRPKNVLCPMCRREIKDVGIVLLDSEDRLELKKTHRLFRQLIDDFKVDQIKRKTVEYIFSLKDLITISKEQELLTQLIDKKEVIELKSRSSQLALLAFGGQTLLKDFIYWLKIIQIGMLHMLLKVV